jgi:hypothetical protein
MVGYVDLGESAMHRLRGFTEFGWYPDPILVLNQPFDIAPPRQLQPVLATVKVPRDAEPGRYTGEITVSAAGRASRVVPVEVTVHDATMPVAPRLPHLIHAGVEGLFPEFRLNPNNGDLGGIYRWGSAVDPDTIREYVQQGMNRFNLHRVSRFYLASRCGKEGEERGAQGFVDYVAGVYPDTRMEQLAALGLTDKAVFYGFDEADVNDPVWRRRIELVFGALRKRYGTYGVRTATTARPWTSRDAWELPVDIWIPLLREYDVVLARLARERGLEVWWYSIGWEIYRRPLWSKALPWASFANEVDGWLYYHMYDWVDRDQRLGDNRPLTSWSPLSEGTRGAYGTGAVVYWDKEGNPQPSLRLVNFREGMLDYDLLCLLRDRVEEIPASANFEGQVALAEARDLLAISWRMTLNDYVVNYNTACASSVTASIGQFRADALRLLDALSQLKERVPP